jgi:hypothetical protein
VPEFHPADAEIVGRVTGFAILIAELRTDASATPSQGTADTLIFSSAAGEPVIRPQSSKRGSRSGISQTFMVRSFGSEFPAQCFTFQSTFNIISPRDRNQPETVVFHDQAAH